MKKETNFFKYPCLQIQSTFIFKALTNYSRNNWFNWSDWLNVADV